MKRIVACVLAMLVFVPFCGCREAERQESAVSTTTTATDSTTTRGTSVVTTTQTTTTTKTTPKVTTKKPAPTSTLPTTTAPLPGWKQVFMGYVGIKSSTYEKFALVDIDDDAIPELFMYGADGHAVEAWREGADGDTFMVRQTLNKDNGAVYIPKSGRFVNVFVDGDHLTMKVYELTDTHFTEVFAGYEYSYLMDDGSVEKVYYITGNSEPMTEEAYEAVLQPIFDVSNARSLHDGLVSAEEIKKKIAAW